MNLKNLTPKDKEMYEIAMERKDDLFAQLNYGSIPQEFEEIIYHISRAEYKRGKADGVAIKQ